MERADVRRPRLVRQPVTAPLQVRRQAARVAQQRDPLPAAREPPRLLHRQPRLPAARATPYLRARQQPDRVEQRPLVLGQPLRLRLPVVREHEQVALQRHPAVAPLVDGVEVVEVRDAVRVLLPLQHAAQRGHQVGHLPAVHDPPPRAVRQLEVLAHRVERQHHRVPEPDPGAVAPPAVAVERVADGVHPVPRLAHRVHLDPAAATRDRPPVLVVPDAAALDLHRHHAEPGEADQRVDLVVLAAVGHPDVGHQQVVVPCLLAQRLPHGPLAVVGKVRLLGRDSRHGAHHGGPG